MASNDDPFRTADALLEKIKAKIIFVDIHAEATSEKIALGWYLDGRVTAVIGTHTHIPTADERVLPKGTAYQTDVGMTGPYDSVIGVDKEQILQRFLKNILNSVMRSAINSTMWRLPLWITILLGVAAAAAMWYWKVF